MKFSIYWGGRIPSGRRFLALVALIGLTLGCQGPVEGTQDGAGIQLWDGSPFNGVLLGDVLLDVEPGVNTIYLQFLENGGRWQDLTVVVPDLRGRELSYFFEPASGTKRRLKKGTYRLRVDRDGGTATLKRRGVFQGTRSIECQVNQIGQGVDVGLSRSPAGQSPPTGYISIKLSDSSVAVVSLRTEKP